MNIKSLQKRPAKLRLRLFLPCSNIYWKCQVTFWNTNICTFLVVLPKFFLRCHVKYVGKEEFKKQEKIRDEEDSVLSEFTKSLKGVFIFSTQDIEGVLGRDNLTGNYLNDICNECNVTGNINKEWKVKRFLLCFIMLILNSLFH